MKTARPIKDVNGNTTGVVLFSRFYRKEEKQDQITYLSYHDHLTGCITRF